MKKQLQQVKKWKMQLLTLLTIGLSAFSVSAQMSGSYTINSGAAASSTNFQNWASFWQSLQGLTRDDGGSTLAGGVSGAVTVSVLTDQTETKQIVFPQISGMSSTNTVTIDGGSKYVAWASSYEVISFTGGDYFTIKNLIIQNSSSTAPIGIRFSGASDYNTISNCTIEFSGITSGTTSSSAYIGFASSSTTLGSASGSSNGSYNTITGCTMRTTNSNSPGPSYGITIMGNTGNYSGTATNNTISGNTIENFYYMGMINFYTNGNQILNNDISRKNSTSYNCYSTVVGIYSLYTYSTNRSTKLDGNSIHDLPFSGSTTGSGPGYIYVFYTQYNYGSTSNRFTINANQLARINCPNYMYLTYNYYNQNVDVTNNVVDACAVAQSSGGSSYFYGMLNYGSFNYRFNGNTIKNCSGGYYFYGIRSEWANSSSTIAEISGNTLTNNSRGYYYTRMIYSYYPQNNVAYLVKINDNVITDNSCDYYYFYGIDASMYGNYEINRNTIMRNKNSGSLGYVYGIYNYYNYTSYNNGNLIADNGGYYGTYGIYAYYGSTNNYYYECKQNTIQIDGSKSGYTYHYGYGLMILQYYHPKVVVHGNIIHIANSYGAIPLYAYSYYSPNAFDWDYNTYYYPNCSYIYYYTVSGSASSIAGWKGMGLCGKNEYYGDPKFVAMGSDYRSNVFENQNNVPTTASSATDVTKAPRNVVKSDRGCRESFMDIKAVSTNFTVPSTVCAGYSVSGGTTITVQNLYVPDTAYNFDVAYAVNGGAKTTEKVTAKMLYNGTATVTFSKGLQLNQVGNNRIAIFIDIPDDNRTNDSFIFNTLVKPAPGGGKFSFSPKPTWAFYQFGKPNDVTVITQPVIYDINAPRAYTNVDYGIKWSASVTAQTAGGVPVSGATLKVPSGSTDMEVQYLTTNPAMEDSMVTIFVKISDLTNGCDTVLTRKVLIYPTIVPDFTFPSKICDGDAVAFDNKSTVRSGNMEFEWDFGTGNPNDITEAPSPVFQFPSTGNYKVKMTARTLPYGFPAWDSAIVNVGPIPTVKFTKVNACEGKALQFTNQTIPSNATYEWDFGNGGKSTLKDPSITYSKAGAYTVTLKANLNGCISEVSQRAYQFDKPKAGFTLKSGTCDNEAFVFENNTTIASGLFGNNWDFNDGTVSTEEAPQHMFTSHGTKNVKLVATSEFGCKDSVTKPIIVKESPVVDFNHDPACSLTPTQFTNTTADVPSTFPIYKWSFGDGGTSGAESPTHSWSSLGPKTVTLLIELDNGCKSSMSKNLVVGVQPKASFEANNVCAGSPVVFENNTTWSQGDISYSWNFGDNTTSTNSDPLKSYNTTLTTTYNVTLKASIAGGCEDQVTKAVTVNEAPQTCDFDIATDYAFGFYGVKLQPKNSSNGNIGGQAGVQYTWVFAGGGTENGSSVNYNFQEDGTYKVTMRAKVLSTGCECSKTQDVVMNRGEVADLNKLGVAVFPNPNTGQFNIALQESFGSEVEITLTNIAGQVVKTQTMANTGLLQVNAGDLADGIYTVSVRSGAQIATSKIHIAR